MDVVSYTPRAVEPEDWTPIAAFVRETVVQAQEQLGEHYVTKDLMGHVAAHVDWCTRVACLPLDQSVLFHRDVIGESTERGFSHLKTTTRATRRSALLRVAEAVLPQRERTTRLAALRDDKLAMPYSSDEQLALRSWAQGQVTPVRRRDCHTILALGLGAGLPSADMARLHVADILVDGQGVLLRVQDSQHPREVPVLASWEQPLVDLVSAREPSALALGVERSKVHSNFVNYLVSRTSSEGGLRPDSRRLRNTWLMHHMASGTPLGPLACAAGLETFRTLEKLAVLLPVPTRDELRREMRRTLRNL